MAEKDRPTNLVDMFEQSVAKHGPNKLFGTKNAAGEYEWVTYSEVGRRVDDLRAGMAAKGIGKGDCVGLIANNRNEWVVVAFATLGLGCRFIPMYEAELTSTWKYIISDSGIKVLFISKPEILEKVETFKADVPCLEQIYVIDAEGPDSMVALEELGREKPVPSVKPDSEDIAVLIYTSGTTGEPKGVLLSHGNFTSNTIDAGSCFPDLGPGDRSLSILPWAHSYGQTADVYNFIHIGGSVAFMGSVQTIVEDLGRAQPTFLIAVPRIFNRVYDGLWAKMDEEGGLPRKLFVMGVESAKQKRELAAQGKSSFMVDLKYKIADAIVFKKIRARFGGKLKGAITGSAMMNPEIALFFSDLGIPTYDCYGLTETSPAATMNRPAKNKIGTVGSAIPNVRIEIDSSVVEESADDGEIIVYGPNVMKGYHNKPDATAEVMTPDGGFRTGDRGKLDEDGFLKVTGRIKEQFKLLNGKYVFPSSIEEEIKLIPMVANAMIYGENKEYNICLVVPDFEVLAKYAEKEGLPREPAALVANEKVQTMISDMIKDALKGTYGSYEIPKKFVFLAEDFTLENGMLTQTLKLKRRAVVEGFQDQIEASYK
ncbi:MAG: long-chain fatty acid--CoA ligase [Actinobacteria bacterium]|nr:long-chain fatty acid--CoA ligase [Actinomycetota bacterium]MBU1944400.1 long-chain fatty acid--CoA ligase [Actinomycetota bacterium]MBU2688268.1 long-chain fatty acid--CoA ligase [Actinomycetota bacterium]